ncbi:hypothetical protein [uncultured Helicobacter sp.]|uniref:hypothetical protein n=1 Tax=uncultured Helicobacter sp. TaxID=175537 RepID=UPI003752DCFC
MRGEGINPFSFCANKRFEKLDNIRENTTLRNLESTESSVDSESKTFIESSAEILKDAQLSESSHLDSVFSHFLESHSHEYFFAS